VFFDERLEEGHSENFALALIDARSEEVVDIISEDVPLQERTPPCVFINSSTAASF
jgi:hypothetical protein